MFQTNVNGFSEIIRWPAAPARVECAGNEVHVFAASLDVGADALAGFRKTLSPEEKERAARFKFDRHRQRFIAGRGCLRSLLGRHLGVDPERVTFACSPQGKPALGPEFSQVGMHFNLAHSEDLGLVAITRAGAVGVDVEHIRALKDSDDLVARFFSERENESYRRLPLEQRPAAFFNLWTRKEALLKATGEGLAGGLNRVEVSFLPGEAARVLAIGGEPAEWSLGELTPAAGFAGAVAIRARKVQVRCWKWE
jgi:4'-phosphopantetheinyl transferase